MDHELILNTAHPAGRTFLAFSRDGNIAYTGGCDSLVRVWRADSGTDKEPDTALDAEEPITALASDNNGWLSGSEDSQVRRYLRTGTELESLITRTNAVSVRYVAVDPKGRRVAVASDDIVVKVIDLDDVTKIKLLNGHKRGVRSASWHPSDSLLTTCGSDGKIIVWNLSEEEPKIEKTLEAIIPTVKDYESNEFGHDCTAVWHTSGLYFIVATTAHEIVTISRSTWSKVSSFSSDDCIGAVTALALSVNGVYLASACKSGIFVWSTATRRVIVQQAIPQGTTVHQLAFSSSQNLLAWTDSRGNLTRWPSVVPPTAPSPTKAAPAAGMSVPARRQATPLFGMDDDALPGDEGGVDAIGGGEVEDQDDDWIIDDLGDNMEDKGDKEFGKDGLREMVSVTKAQPAFQPGSTPFQNKRRYLSFNNIGVVEVIDQDTHHIVNVEFHDQTTRKNYHFTDPFKYDLAAVGERGIVYACPPEAGHPARVHYKPFSTWATHGEWTYTLPPGERAVAVAAGGTPPTRALRTLQEADVEGNGYVAIATDAGVVRFFSGGGLQRGPVWALDGDLIAMVAGRDYVFVVHREGGTSLDGNQNLKYTLRTSDTFRVMHTGRLPVNKGKTLKWIGISDEGAPVIYDSSERIMMLEHFRFTAQGSWAVLLDATQLARRAGKDESYWPIGVTKSIMMCIILKGREGYPGFPRPLAQEIDMTMPYLDMDDPEAQKAERVAREGILLDHLRDALDEDTLTSEDISKTELDLDKELILVIQLACKHDRLQRALDAAKLLHHAASLEGALKIADFYHLAGLREKLGVLRAVRAGADRLRDERARRADWRGAAGAVPQAHDPYAGLGQGAPRPFQDAQPPPAIHRPRLVAATPSAEPSPFSRKPAAPQISEATSSRTLVEDSPPPEKRKRDVIDENEDSSVPPPEYKSKRQAVEDISRSSIQQASE
ncbi:WD40 repeat-like protein [Phellopilus nigrolimitatus]|nr:WD40 repeat-like protein [Phellopilus nigrolimitatus]